MARIKPINPEQASDKAKQLLDAVNTQMGGVPNIFTTLAQSPASLEALLNFNGALAQGVLPVVLREQIALTVAGKNQCDYCASAHSVLGKGAGIDEDELEKNLHGTSADESTRVVLNFIRNVVDNRGDVSDSDVNTLRAAGYGDAAIIEIIAHIAINTFTNYFNRIAGTEIDFPVVNTSNVAKAA